MELPELPRRVAEAVMDLCADHEGPVEAMQYLPEGTEFYTTDQVREIQRAAAQAALDAAAKVCEEEAILNKKAANTANTEMGAFSFRGIEAGALNCADAIRAIQVG